MERKQRKRLPIMLAGSPLAASGGRGFQKLPQSNTKAPESEPKAEPKADLPTSCRHGVQLSQQDFDLYERIYAGRLFLLHGSEVLADGSNVGPHPYEAKACPECYSTCLHGEQLTAKEIECAKKSGKKISQECAVCTVSTDPKAWNQFLRGAGYSEYRGMAPAELYIPTREGGVIALGQRKTAPTGNIEEIDTQKQIRDEIPTPGDGSVVRPIRYGDKGKIRKMQGVKFNKQHEKNEETEE